ncbi:translation initiation inhibitor, yjgF family protein [Rhizobium sp. Root73]|uniref:Rid family hydrolase n=1 Tax=unclassified Rhizobium TaxID=2613769 RepID=UPI00072994FE|nr:MULTISPECIES: Rid family hydrolase [unclassified Rhizobium]KQY08898.1 translation initiation inhibitor, yjgF family protein [Rhizobium sp. Root1334]KRC03237.1 translation initiation inhibitor, yjgF family protein [Rhizobium sp. Root73]
MEHQTNNAVHDHVTSTGKVVVPAVLKDDVEQFHYAPARRAGDFVFLSGVVASNGLSAPMDAEGFRHELRRAFILMEQLLHACQARMDDVVELQMFHVFGSDRLILDKAGQLAAIAAVRDEFFPAPYPACVELAVADLNPEGGLVEIKATAFAPLSLRAGI